MRLRPMHLRRIHLCIALWLIAASGVSSQSQNSNPSSGDTRGKSVSPSIKVSSSLVLVPAIVAKTSGDHVSELSREDFTLLKNGQLQQIAFFEHVRAGSELPAQPEAPASQFSNITPYHSQRLTIFVLDLLNSSQSEQRTARDQLVKFLSSPAKIGEPICLFALDVSGLTMLQDFTTDPAILAQALRQLSPRSAGKDVAAENPLATSLGQVAGWNTKSPTRQAAALQNRASLLKTVTEFRETGDAMRIALTLYALRVIGESFAGVPGKKSLIWSTGGFPFEIDDRARFGSHESRLLSDYDETWRALNRANIAVYPLDVEQSVNPAFVGPSSGEPLPEHFFARVSVNNLERFAEMTGGKMCYRSQDAKSCFKQVEQDSSDYYLLGFYDDQVSKPGWQKLAVKVNLPRVEVRSRAGYYVGSSHQDTQSAQRDLQVALASPLDYTGVPLTLSWTSTIAHEDQPKRQVSFKLSIPAGGIDVDQPSQQRLNLQFVAEAVTTAGEPGTSFSETLDSKLSPELATRINAQGLSVPGTLQLAAGTYFVTFAVRDNIASQIGTLTATLTVP